MEFLNPELFPLRELFPGIYLQVPLPDQVFVNQAGNSTVVGEAEKILDLFLDDHMAAPIFRALYSSHVCDLNSAFMFTHRAKCTCSSVGGVPSGEMYGCANGST